MIRYRGAGLSRGEVDALSDALAVAFGAAGLVPGDRVAVQLQNVPEFALTVLAAWKTGVAIVPVNPMYKGRELAHLLADSGARLVVCDLADAVAVRELAGESVAVVAAGATPAGTPGSAAVPGVVPFDELVGRHRGRRPEVPRPRAADAALVTYTSGTTGPAKGAVASHANVRFGAEVYRDEAGVAPGSVVLAVAPLGHITGMIGHLAVSLLAPAVLVLIGRFEPSAALEAIEQERVTFVIAAMTAYQAMLREPSLPSRDLTSLTSLYSGGAPVPPAVAQEVRAAFGVALGNAYGLTETTSITHLTPRDETVPVDLISGALSIGRPARGVKARIVDDAGRDVGSGASGELVVRSGGVVSGYWRNEAATAEAFGDGWLRTGDVARRDAERWFYMVDRKKDQIKASGFKVWPREVEDVL